MKKLLGILLLVSFPAHANWFGSVQCSPLVECMTNEAHVEATAANWVIRRVGELCPGGMCPAVNDRTAIVMVRTAIDNCQEYVQSVEVTWEWIDRSQGRIRVINDEVTSSRYETDPDCRGSRR